MKPFYHLTGPKDECYCGSGNLYKDCCLRSDLFAFVGALLLIGLTLILPPGSWAVRVLWAIGGGVLWFGIFQCIRGWLIRRRSGKGQHQPK